MPLPDYINYRERTIAQEIVTTALVMGYAVSVQDGEEWVVRRSMDEEKILSHMGSTAYDTLRLRDREDQVVGDITLIWGNGTDLISDHSDNPRTNEFCGKLQDWVDVRFL